MFDNFKLQNMKLFLFSSFLLFISFGINAQVGIGTTSPTATLDVVAVNPTGTSTSVDGILIPRVTRQRAQSMTTIPTSTIIYVNDVLTGTASGTTINVTAVGFYFFNGTVWERVGGTGSSNDWTTTGNTGIVDGTNYIGTAASTNVDVAFRRNDLAAGKIGATSTSFGLGALTLGAASTSSAFGNNALTANTTGAANVAVGTSALAANISSANNTAVGFNSLIANTAAGNSAFGYRALGSNVSGTNNTAFGFDAGFALTGSNNIMIGASTVAPVAANNDQLNIGNTLFGSMAGALTSGVNTTRTIGVNVLAPQAALDIVSSNNGLLIPRIPLTLGANFQAPLSTVPTLSEIIYNTSTTTNAAFGIVTPGFYFWNASNRWERFNTGPSTGWLTTGNTVGAAGSFIGTLDGFDLAFRRSSTAAGFIGANSTALGVSSLAVNTGTNNTAFGTNALAANGSPSNNTAVGFNALAINTLQAGSTGDRNTALGSGALATLNGGAGNTAIGYNALTASPTTSLNNTAVGSGALQGVNNSAARDNVAVGYNAMIGIGSMTNSVAIGSNALVSASGGATRNTVVGFSAGSNISGGTDNVAIGANAQPNAAGTNEIVIGSGIVAGGYKIVIGGTGIAGAAYVHAPSWTTSSDRRLKSDIKDSPLGLDFIKTIRPVSYFRTDDINKKTEYGFIAQELDIALQNARSTNNGIVSITPNGMFGVRYNDFLPISIKAIQEQQEEIEALKKANDELIKTNATILKRLEALERK